MEIACLAWGSLVWDPRDLPIASTWYEDGPGVQVEFAHQSGGQRLTLVMGESFQVVPSLWAWMDCSNLDDAIEGLRRREGTVTRRIGFWSVGDDTPKHIVDLPGWAVENRADAVIWTALPPKFQGRDERIPSVDEALEYLSSLDDSSRQGAEKYVRKTPTQVRTPYRSEFERQLGWLPL